MADMVEVATLAVARSCVVCLEGDNEEGEVLLLQCCNQPLHTACLRRHVAAKWNRQAYLLGSDEASLARMRVKCPACNVTLKRTSARGALCVGAPPVTSPPPSAPPSPPPTPVELEDGHAHVPPARGEGVGPGIQ